MTEYVGASSFEVALRKVSSMIKRYSRVFPPSFATSSPAAFAEPPATAFVTLGTPYRRSFFFTSRDEVVNDHDVLAGLDSVRLHLEDVLPQTRKLPLDLPL